ncbi:ABC transporter permease [Calidifontibacter sp. DB0510]|uniref:ABC transporter permease n=1 Tax=Metallococcus carri TaxID=1656884 RepID=A0A967AXX9_9MICO|nr:ABC transporter permease [Metallococcus carri]NHN55034.1 ABC transporter permease [Metallococcus carri]NOP37380.1 ABC transporter permease [Calidifontibacter sp. DB2511S]
MLVYIIRRILLMISVVFAAVTLTFVLFFLAPNDPAGAICASPNCSPARIAEIEKSMGLDRPKVQQYGEYMKGIVAGRDITSGGFKYRCDAPCLGWSWIQNQSATDMVKLAFPVTVSIMLGGVVVYSILGLLGGVIAARNRGNWLDRLIVAISQFVPSIPYYILALLFYLYLMVLHPILPQSDYTSPFDNPVAWATGLLGVWFIYGVIQSTAYVRYVRALMIDSLSGDFVRTARSKGLSERKVVINHALRATMAPFLTLVGLNIAADLSGAVFTESIFGLNGMGRLAIQSFNQSDLQVISAVVVVGAVVVSLGNLIVDLLYGLVDPRVKLN